MKAPAPLIAGSGFSIGGMRANELLSEYTLSQSVATEVRKAADGMAIPKCERSAT